MDFENRTPFPARLFRSSIADDEMIAAAMARVTFDLTPDGPVPSPDQAWSVTREPVETLHGAKDSDDLYYREGADVLLLGSARAEGGRPRSAAPPTPRRTGSRSARASATSPSRPTTTCASTVSASS